MGHHGDSLPFLSMCDSFSSYKAELDTSQVTWTFCSFPLWWNIHKIMKLLKWNWKWKCGVKASLTTTFTIVTFCFWKACPRHKHLLRHYDWGVILGWKYMCTFKADCVLNIELQRMVPKCFTVMYLYNFNSMTGSDLCRIDPWASPSEQYWEIS